jgi:hypothetical protein
MVGVGHIFQIRLGRDWRGPTRITGRRTALRVNWREGDDLFCRVLRFVATSTTAEWNDRKRCNAEHEKQVQDVSSQSTLLWIVLFKPYLLFSSLKESKNQATADQ